MALGNSHYLNSTSSNYYYRDFIIDDNRLNINILHLYTAGKFIDRDIQIKCGVRQASVATTANSSLNIHQDMNDYNIVNLLGNQSNTAPLDNYYFALQSNVIAETRLTSSTASGWIGSPDATNTINNVNNELVSSTTVSNAITYFPVPLATGSITAISAVNICSLGTSSNVTLSDTANSGILFNFIGQASFEMASYIESAGFIPASANFASMSAPMAILADSGVKYITGVNLTTGKEFDITVPNGNEGDTITFHFEVDENNNVTIDSGDGSSLNPGTDPGTDPETEIEYKSIPVSQIAVDFQVGWGSFQGEVYQIDNSQNHQKRINGKLLNVYSTIHPGDKFHLPDGASNYKYSLVNQMQVIVVSDYTTDYEVTVDDFNTNNNVNPDGTYFTPKMSLIIGHINSDPLTSSSEIDYITNNMVILRPIS